MRVTIPKASSILVGAVPKKCYSNEFRQKMSLISKNFWSKQSLEYRKSFGRKVSAVMKEYYSHNPKKPLTEKTKRLIRLHCKGKGRRLGHIVTEETRQKIRNKLMGHSVSDETRRKLHLKNSGKTYPKDKYPNLGWRGIRPNQIFPEKDTILEKTIQNRLNDLHIQFSKHKNIENFVQCDIFIEPNIVIFVDGCYWHACPICFPNRTKLTNQQTSCMLRDIVVNEFFNKLGDKYIVFRFYEHDIESKLEECINKIIGIGKLPTYHMTNL